ncbi:isoprenyl transferase [Bacteroides bouchesdurhonensis]|uniref:isoprenyl transferase n=1 Tax=Bacteroides bouchesdurhonensis TaxID=1841855 RepID=UPI00097F9DBF|nr:isoprenyl transferase [Bacteroides bouchesdurhonensis]
MSYIEQIDKTRIPKHVAIIMDGNGRWAKQQGKERTFGHQAGAETVQNITEEAARLGVKYLTLYTFSTENWNRPQDEIAALMNLLLNSIEEETLMKNNICFRVIGDFEKLPTEVQDSLSACIEHTSKNTGMCLVLALSYSSRWEISEAVRQIAIQVKNGEITPEQITDGYISSHLTTSFMPDPDLLIRTGGEIRLSNYLLWQCAYSEFYFCDTFWPDFNNEEFRKAIYEYQQRERRFGKTSEQIS